MSNQRRLRRQLKLVAQENKMSNQGDRERQLKPVAQENKMSKLERFLWIAGFGFTIVGLIASGILLCVL